MASQSQTGQSQTGLRWWRALLAAFLAEVGLILVAVPLYATMADAQSTINAVIPPASFVLFLPAGYWAARPVARSGIAQGALTGAWAVALYLALGLVASQFTDEASLADSLTPAYLLSHALKIVGGAVGGWLVARRAAAAL